MPQRFCVSELVPEGYSPAFRMSLLRTAAVAALLAIAALSAAKPPFLKVFMAYYKINPHSAIGKARCLNCHQSPGPPHRNPYGNAVSRALADAHARFVNEEILKSVETKDMGEGLTFLAKIKHDMPPGQPKPKAVKPKGKSKSKGKSKKQAALLNEPHVILMLALAGLGPISLITHRASRASGPPTANC